MRTKFVAEIASNHNQNVARCLELINDAKDMGCWGVKFQLFSLEKLFSKEALLEKPELLKRKKWELPREFVPLITREANRNGLALGFTPFDLDAVDFLYQYVDFYKIASYNILDVKLLRSVARTGKGIVLSTGAATIDEIMMAVNVIKSVDKHVNLTLLHCVSAYPTPVEQCNLRTMDRLKLINKKVGWSDHSVNPAVIYNAVLKYDAEMIEFHYDLSDYAGEDRGSHSWDFYLMKLTIDNLKDAYKSDGQLPKMNDVEPCEEKERNWRADPSDGLRPLRSERLRILSDHEINA